MNVIHAWFEQQVAQTPEATAVKYGAQSISYQTLNDCANHLALQLHQAGACPDMRIALCLPRSIEQIIAIFAVLKSGAAYLPLDPNQSSKRLDWILQECDTSILITLHSNHALFTQFTGTILFLEETYQSPKLSTPQLQTLETIRKKASGDHLAYVIYTSGSTGVPKGVMIEHHSVIHYCQWFQTYTHFSANQLVDYSSNYIFDFGITSSLIPLMLGATLVICADEIKKDPDSYLRYLANEKITLINITPSFFKELLHTPTFQQSDLPDLQSLILGGENLPSADCQVWLSRFKNHILFNEYGPTETTVGVTQHSVRFEKSDLTSSFVPIGKPASTIQTFLYNEQFELVKPGDIGELYIGGPCLARGYLNQPQLSDQSFLNMVVNQQPIRLYKTGDLCRQNKAGELECIGRKDKQIKIRGYRVELSEIEIQLRQFPGIQDVITLVRYNQNNEPLLIAYYILQPSAAVPSFEQLHHYLMTLLPDFMVPNAFVQIDSFPRTANDKLDERALPMPLMTSSQLYQAPQTSTEQAITVIWVEEMRHPHIGIHDNFFELGGHSLLAARIIAKIAQQMSKKISLQAFYHAPTIAQLASLVTQAPSAEPLQPLVLQNHSKSLPLHDFQLLMWLGRLGGPKLQVYNMIWRRRVQGPVDKTALDLALQWVLQKQEIFSYHIHLLYPLQSPCKKPNEQFRQWRTTSLSDLSIEESERYLAQHYDDLFYKKIWRAKSLWISADLFYLPNEQVELQICMSHMIVDESCYELFFRNLSHAYLFFTKQTQIHTNHALRPYKNYISQHHQLLRQQAEPAASFWADYLQDAGSFHFPPQYVQQNTEAASTQIALPPNFVEKLRGFCAQHCVAINDVLCAAVSLALLQCCDHDLRCAPHKLVIFTTKSTRDDPQYDQTIGCFLRVDPIKLELSKDANLVSLAKQAQQSANIGAPFQHASSLVKYAAVGKLQLCLSQNPIKRFLINKAFAMLSRYFPELKLDKTLFNACEVVAILDQTKQFLMNINMPQDFLEEPATQNHPSLLGLPEVAIPYHPFRNPLIKYMLDIYFHRSSDQNTRYIVLTSNLRPDFQRRLGETVTSLIAHCL